MRRGTTPKHTFQLPKDASELKVIKITYAQLGKEVLVKRKDDCVLDGASASVTLTQEETLMFKAGHQFNVQIRALSFAGEAFVSDPTVEIVEGINDNDEVLA